MNAAAFALWWKPFAALLLSYLLGSIPTGFLLVKWTKGIDVRTVGSGNVGATNAARAAGRGVAFTVFVIDALKGFISAALIASLLWPEKGVVASAACGAAAVIGHVFPLFLNFQGGKGVATAIGMLAAVSWQALVVFLLVWAIGMGLSRYVSVGSIFAAATIPITQVVIHQPLGAVLAGAAVALLIVLRHRGNIQRLFRGQEHRLSFGSG